VNGHRFKGFINRYTNKKHLVPDAHETISYHCSTAFFSMFTDWVSSTEFKIRITLYKERNKLYHIEVNRWTAFISMFVYRHKTLLNTQCHLKITNNTCKYYPWALVWKVTRFGFIQRHNDMNYWPSLGSITNSAT